MEFKVSWLDYSKQILEKVSFDALLFTKELNKAINILTDEEIVGLEKWVYETFSLNLSLEAVKLIDNR
jgi:hypothetical protein